MTSFLVFIALAALAVQIALIWAIFNMRNHIERHTSINIAVARMLTKIAINTGTDKDEAYKLLDDLKKQL